MLGALKLIMNSADLAILYVSIIQKQKKSRNFQRIYISNTRSIFLHNPVCNNVEFQFLFAFLQVNLDIQARLGNEAQSKAKVLGLPVSQFVIHNSDE